jgi:hypothetical protein
MGCVCTVWVVGPSGPPAAWMAAGLSPWMARARMVARSFGQEARSPVEVPGPGCRRPGTPLPTRKVTYRATRGAGAGRERRRQTGAGTRRARSLRASAGGAGAGRFGARLTRRVGVGENSAAAIQAHGTRPPGGSEHGDGRTGFSKGAQDGASMDASAGRSDRAVGEGRLRSTMRSWADDGRGGDAEREDVRGPGGVDFTEVCAGSAWLGLRWTCVVSGGTFRFLRAALNGAKTGRKRSNGRSGWHMALQGLHTFKREKKALPSSVLRSAAITSSSKQATPAARGCD